MTVRSSLCRVSASVGREGGRPVSPALKGEARGCPPAVPPPPRVPRPLTRGTRGHGRACCVPSQAGGGGCLLALLLQPQRGGAQRRVSSGPAAPLPRPSREQPPRVRAPGGRFLWGQTQAQVPTRPAPRPPRKLRLPPRPARARRPKSLTTSSGQGREASFIGGLGSRKR